jgi:hypothetical protein
MRRRRKEFQEDLFESSETQEMHRRVRELDTLIAKAVKAKNFDDAKALTDQQEQLLQKLMKMGDSAGSR